MVTGTLILIKETLRFPTSVNAQTDTRLLREFVSRLETLEMKGHDLDKMLSGVSKILDIVLHVVDNPWGVVPGDEMGRCSSTLQHQAQQGMVCLLLRTFFGRTQLTLASNCDWL
jgi:hypothetical protein